jgi:hypothetical protein
MNYYQKYLKYKDKYIKLKQLKGGYILPLLNEINESEFAIVCHCSPQYQSQFEVLHRKLYYIDKQNNKTIQEIGRDIKYVDTNPSCENDTWTKIDDNSLMYIWGINCPIYMIYLKGSESRVLDMILKDSFRKLKLNGKVFFPVLESYEQLKIKNNNCIKEKIRDGSECFYGYSFEIVSINEFPYIIGNNHDLELEIKEYYVFTKYLE